MNKKLIKAIWRYPYRTYNHIKLKKEVTLISCNCIGDVMYSDAKQKFLSPTINLIITNFLDFCENLEECLKCEPRYAGYNASRKCIRVEIKYSKGIIEIYPIHYKNFNDFIIAWNRRKLRVNFDRIYIVATDEYIRSQNDKKRFESLPYKKICFTSKLVDNSNYIFCEEFFGMKYVGDVLRYSNIFGVRIFEKNFNYIKWLNDE